MILAADNAAWYATRDTITGDTMSEIKRVARVAASREGCTVLSGNVAFATASLINRAVADALNVGWDVARGAAYDAAKKMGEDAAKNIAKPGECEIVGIQAARGSLRYVIANEEMIYSVISLRLRSAIMCETVDRERVIDKLLGVDTGHFKGMNRGAQCWYLSRIWSLMLLADLAESAGVERYKTKYFNLVERCENPIVAGFVEWIIGPVFSRAHFLQKVKSFPRSLLPLPLWEIVYHYLTAPSPGSIRREILSLI